MISSSFKNAYYVVQNTIYLFGIFLKGRKWKTSMFWPSQNFLLHKSTILIKYFISNFLRFFAIEAEIQLWQVFQKKKKKKKKNRVSY